MVDADDVLFFLHFPKKKKSEPISWPFSRQSNARRQVPRERHRSKWGLVEGKKVEMASGRSLQRPFFGSNRRCRFSDPHRDLSRPLSIAYRPGFSESLGPVVTSPRLRRGHASPFPEKQVPAQPIVLRKKGKFNSRRISTAEKPAPMPAVAATQGHICGKIQQTA